MPRRALCTGLWPTRPCAGGLRSGIVKLGAGIARTSSDCESPPDVPTLFRFLAFIGIIAGLIFGGMIALVTFLLFGYFFNFALHKKRRLLE